MDAQGSLTPPAHVAAAVIAGGQGSRMGGVPKGLLRVQGQTIIERQLAQLLPLFARVFIVANDQTAYAGLGVDVVADRVGPGLGPIAGLEAALAALLPHETDVVCVAADMPFLTGNLLMALRDHAPSALAVVPYAKGFPEPLCARYAKAAQGHVQAALTRHEYKLMQLLDQLQAQRLPDALFLSEALLGRFATNVNTPEDLDAASRPSTCDK